MANLPIDKLLSKLDKLETINYKDIVDKHTNEVIDSIKSKVPFNTGLSKSKVGVISELSWNTGAVVKIGMDGSFNTWRGAYFQNLGYVQHYYGKSTGKMTTKNKGWFNIDVKRQLKVIQKTMKNEVLNEIKRIF